MSKLKGVLFDKDGTLIDFHASWIGPMRRLALDLSDGDAKLADSMLEAIGFDHGSQRAAADSVMAAGNTHDLAETWKPFLRVDNIAALESKIDVYAVQEGVISAEPVVPLRPFFERLRERGLSLGIATSDSEAGARGLVKRHQAEQLLDFISGYDSGHGSKTGPGMALAFAESTGHPPESLAVVGDNLTDLMMGRAAGYGCLIAVMTGTGERSSLAVLADVVLPSIAHLMPWLEERGFLEA